MPSAVDDTEQLNYVNLLGVLFQDNLKMDSHTFLNITVLPTNISPKAFAISGYATRKA